MAKAAYILYLVDGTAVNSEGHNLFEATHAAGIETSKIAATRLATDQALVWSPTSKSWHEKNDSLKADAELIALAYARIYNTAKPEIGSYFGITESNIAKAYASLNRIYDAKSRLALQDELAAIGIECTPQTSENVGLFFVLRPVIEASDVEIIEVHDDDLKATRETLDDAG